MTKLIIIFKILGSILIICATLIATIIVTHFDKQISVRDNEIANFHDTRILTTLGILSYENRDNLLATQEVEYYQQLIHEHQLTNESNSMENYKKDLVALQDTMKATQETIMDNNIFLAVMWSTLLSKDKEEEKITRGLIDKIKNDKNLSMTQKIEKIRGIQDKNQKVFGERLADIHNRWNKNLEAKEKLENIRVLWQAIFIWMQILGLSLLAISEAIEGVQKMKEERRLIQKKR